MQMSFEISHKRRTRELEIVPLPDLKEETWIDKKEELEAFAKTFDHTARLKEKKSFIWNIGFLKVAATTIGPNIYIPSNWKEHSVRYVIPHEVGGHVKQFKFCGLGIHPWAGVPLMLLLYFLLFFPVFLAWPRYRLELHASAVSWRYHLEQKLWGVSDVKIRAAEFAKTVSSSAYLYAVPLFWAKLGFKRKAERVIEDYVLNKARKG